MQYSISGPGGRPGENKNSEIHLLKFQLSKHCLIKLYIPNEMRKKIVSILSQESSERN